MKLSTPVAFLIFNRPDVTAKVFEAIRKAQPPKLLIVADGPRPDKPQDIDKCEATRAILNKVDWDCDVITNFSETNLGCGRRVSSGITWVFSQVEEAIFLEDDTLPTPSFFYYCQELLERYRDDTRVMHINGDNSLGQVCNPYSYFFSKYMHCWGWASWRRAWNYYDYNLTSWPDFCNSGLFQQMCDDIYEQRLWEKIFSQMHQDPQLKDTWDYQWTYACLSQGGLTITPNRNLISNIGFQHVDSSHATGSNPRANLPTDDIWDIHHPPFLIRDRDADRRTFDFVFNGDRLRKLDTPIGRLKQTTKLTYQGLRSRISPSPIAY